MFDHLDGTEIAIIGMAGRFPGASTLDAFWRNLCDGVESVSFPTDRELEAFGADPAALSAPQFVKAVAVLDDMELFDAPFFGINHREAQIMDPQHRVFLECAWEALESAGYIGDTQDRAVGVFGGASTNTYLLFNLMSNPEILGAFDPVQIDIASSGDFLTTRVSYKLNLKGPSHHIQSACSTSLVAVHTACQSLLNEECDIALAGGVSINVSQRTGYRYLEGGIVSPDGHCRAFDARAAGTIFSSGAGVVVLKRLEDALADRDTIHAVIRGSAVNNDGAMKVGYTAPSVEGQAEVIAEALSNAGISDDTISYIEAHGTGTAMGDPIEIQALTKAFGPRTERRGTCAIGSVKTNIGHMGAAAGIAGLIKTVLALKHQRIPPSLHFERPNPDIDFANSPFSVNTRLAEWTTAGIPRRAGVSSFGVGGTNAHVVLEEAPFVEPSGPSRPWQLLALSAKSLTALNTATNNLADYIQAHPDIALADVAYTLHVGRRALNYRGVLVCHDRDDALKAIHTLGPQRIFTGVQEASERPVVFMFPGQGAQYVQMGRELYQTESLFREQVDRCAALLRPHLGVDLRELLYGDQETRRPGDTETGRHGDWENRNEGNTQSSVLSPQSSFPNSQLDQTQYAQPALFVIEYALAQLWMSWGVRPSAMVGHSIGEYVAACLAGVFSLEDALALVAARGRLMQQLPGGAMLAVHQPEREVVALLGDQLALAAVNGPALCVVAGPTEAIDALELRLGADAITCRRLHTSHAFHSAMMDPVVAPLAEQARRIALKPPQIPYLSNFTGTWISDADATDPGYWARHLRAPVRFADNLRELARDPNRIMLEVGPGSTLSQLAKQHGEASGDRVALASMRHPREQQSDVGFLLTTLGRLWLAGAEVNWSELYRHEQRRRVPLPTYPFERQRYWIAPRRPGAAYDPAQAQPDAPQPELAEPAHLPSPTHRRPNLDTAYVAPRNEGEERIAAIWQEMLGIAQIGVHDNFFSLGGHSLLALQLISRLRDSFQVELPLDDFFKQSTVAGLAEVIAAHQPEQDDLDEIARILAEIESLSADDLASALDEDGIELGPPLPAEPEVVPEVAPMPHTNGGSSHAEHALGNGAVIEPAATPSDRPIEFSLCYFSSDEQEFTNDKYRLLIEGAKLADRYGFSSVWTPERHFHAFGGLYPNPSVLNAALAMVTQRVKLRAGSVVLPLHHPVRVAEEWSMLDNMSNGRVGIGFASGWHADDFIFYPEHYADRRAVMFQGIETIRRLWRGESVAVRGGTGKETAVRLFPRPIQPELPVWVTASGNSAETFIRAGEIGANVLTALIEMSFEQLTERIALYRESRARHGYDPQAGHVTLMLHTFIGDDLALVKETVRLPFYSYLRSLGGLLRNLAKSLDMHVNVDALSPQDEQALIAFAFERYFASASLMGTPEKCADMVDRLRAIGVNEIACLIDFGVDVDAMLASLQNLYALSTQYQAATPA